MPKVRELVPQSNESDLFRVGFFALIIDSRFGRELEYSGGKKGTSSRVVR
jgi:hypothetical protein